MCQGYSAVTMENNAVDHEQPINITTSALRGYAQEQQAQASQDHLCAVREQGENLSLCEHEAEYADYPASLAGQTPIERALDDVARCMTLPAVIPSFGRRATVPVFAMADAKRYSPCEGANISQPHPVYVWDVYVRQDDHHFHAVKLQGDWAMCSTHSTSALAWAAQNMIRTERPWLVPRIARRMRA